MDGVQRWIETDTSEAFLPDVNIEGVRWTAVAVSQAEAESRPPTSSASAAASMCSCPTRGCRQAPGDVLAFLDTGAYQDAGSNNFNAMPRPATVLVHGDRRGRQASRDGRRCFGVTSCRGTSKTGWQRVRHGSDRHHMSAVDEFPARFVRSGDELTLEATIGQRRLFLSRRTLAYRCRLRVDDSARRITFFEGLVERGPGLDDRLEPLTGPVARGVKHHAGVCAPSQPRRVIPPLRPRLRPPLPLWAGARGGRAGGTRRRLRGQDGVTREERVKCRVQFASQDHDVTTLHD